MPCDAIIDFSHPSVLTALLDYSVKNNIPTVLCTTGISETQMIEIEDASKKVALFKSANMSLGVNLVTRLFKASGKVFGRI